MASLQCPIDMEALTSNDEIVSTPCGHVFHRHCVSDWLQTDNKCPQCRKAVRPEQLIRLYIDVSDEELRRLQREKKDIQRESENVRSVGAVSHDSDAIYLQLEMTEIALCEERDRHEKTADELEATLKHSQQIENVRLSLLEELQIERAEFTTLECEIIKVTEKFEVKSKELAEAQQKVIKYGSENGEYRSTNLFLNTCLEKLMIRHEEAEKRNRLLSGELEAAKQLLADRESLSKRMDSPDSSACVTQPHEACMDCMELRKRLNKAEYELIDLKSQLHEKATDISVLSAELEAARPKSEVQKLQTGQESSLDAENETSLPPLDLVATGQNSAFTHHDTPATTPETLSVDEAKTESSTTAPGGSGQIIPPPCGRRNVDRQIEAVSQDPSGSHSEAPRPTSECEEAAEESDFRPSVDKGI